MIKSEPKWQKMSSIVNQHSSKLNLSKQFKKLFINRLLKENILVFLLQYTGLMFTTLTPNPTPLWFASGTACAFIFLRGSGVLPGIWLGSFIAYLLAKTGIIIAFGCATIFALQADSIRRLTYRFSGPTLIFYHLKPFLKFIICIGIITAIASLLLEFFSYSCLNKVLAPFDLWLQWWLANFNGTLIFACALITWDAYFPYVYALKKLIYSKASVLFSLLAILTILLLLNTNPLVVVGISLAILILTILISVFYGWCGVITAIFLSGIILSLGAILRAPYFETIDYLSAEIIFIQIFLALQSILGIFTAIEFNSRCVSSVE